ncbi:YybH family protein [Pseudomonadota bacterium]
MTNRAITGQESINEKAATPMGALVEFYRAFNSGDLELMANNWDQTDEASMSNPLGDVKRGWASICEVYQKIFNGSAKVYVEFYDYSIHSTGEMFIAVGRERGHFQQGFAVIELAIRTSRTYQMKNGQWHQIHHHGSIDDPKLLNLYQSQVLRK